MCGASSNHVAKIPMRLLRLKDVKSMTGLSKSTIYARLSAGSFPKQIALGPRLVCWVEADIQNWIAAQISAARE
jgi:prophage regulatory protein